MDKKHPSLIKQGKNLVGAITRVAQKKINGGKIITTDEEFDDRMELCLSNACGNLDELTNSCFICGCYLDQKLALTTEECPIGFWSSIE